MLLHDEKKKEKTQPYNKKTPICKYFPSKVTFAAAHVLREPQHSTYCHNLPPDRHRDRLVRWTGVTRKYLRAGFGFRHSMKAGIGNHCAACFLTADPNQLWLWILRCEPISRKRGFDPFLSLHVCNLQARRPQPHTALHRWRTFYSHATSLTRDYSWTTSNPVMPWKAKALPQERGTEWIISVLLSKQPF